MEFAVEIVLVALLLFLFALFVLVALFSQTLLKMWSQIKNIFKMPQFEYSYHERMTYFKGSTINTSLTGATVMDISWDPEQTVLLFDPEWGCSDSKMAEIQKTIVGKLLSERDVIIVTKGQQLMDLISDAVEEKEQRHVKNNSVRVISFVPKLKYHVVHYATLLKKVPLSVAKDLASSYEFTSGYLWFLIPSDVTTIDQHGSDIISDIIKLSTFTYDELPILKNEAVALPVMNEGTEIMWFKPDPAVYQKEISPSC